MFYFMLKLDRWLKNNNSVLQSYNLEMGWRQKLKDE